jgi:hypothetical protein
MMVSAVKRAACLGSLVAILAGCAGMSPSQEDVSWCWNTVKAGVGDPAKCAPMQYQAEYGRRERIRALHDLGQTLHEAGRALYPHPSSTFSPQQYQVPTPQAPMNCTLVDMYYPHGLWQMQCY